jgi:hypothetical protein
MKRILFEDDEPQVLQALRASLYLRRKDWEIHFARGGQRAGSRQRTAPRHPQEPGEIRMNWDALYIELTAHALRVVALPITLLPSPRQDYAFCGRRAALNST